MFRSRRTSRRSQLLSTQAEQKVKDLEAQIAEKDKTIENKTKEIEDLKGAPGAETVDEPTSAPQASPRDCYNALCDI